MRLLLLEWQVVLQVSIGGIGSLPIVLIRLL
jgi:hypothetical protein